MVAIEGKRWNVGIWGFFGIFVLALLIPVAQAEERIDFTQYNTCTTTMLLADKEFSVYSAECVGITRSNQENKVFENMTVHHVALGREEAGQGTQHNLSVYKDRDGDYVIMEFNESRPPGGRQEGTWKILYGSGKWKGIKGSGKHVHLGYGRIKPGTEVVYSRNTGTFELPK